MAAGFDLQPGQTLVLLLTVATAVASIIASQLEHPGADELEGVSELEDKMLPEVCQVLGEIFEESYKYAKKNPEYDPDEFSNAADGTVIIRRSLDEGVLPELREELADLAESNQSYLELRHARSNVLWLFIASFSLFLVTTLLSIIQPYESVIGEGVINSGTFVGTVFAFVLFGFGLVRTWDYAVAQREIDKLLESDKLVMNPDKPWKSKWVERLLYVTVFVILVISTILIAYQFNNM